MFRTTARLVPVLACAVAVFVAACQTPLASTAATVAVAPTASAQPTATAAPSVVPTKSATAATQAPPVTACVAESVDLAVVVPSTSNIFAAGRAVAQAPAGGGGGTLPPAVELDAGDAAVTFPCADGLVNCCFGAPDTSPAGTIEYTTDITSWRGVSGIIHAKRSIFLVGVFLGPDEPADPAPDRLDFTGQCTRSCDFASLEPELGQTFFIGDGGAGKPRYVIPEGATRLFLGIADGYLTHGAPGWYANNSGAWTVVVSPGG